MNSLVKVAVEFQSFLQKQNWKFCIIGGLALQRWGEPRVTQDIDITLLTGIGGEARFVDTLLQHYYGRLSDTRDFALQNRVLLLKSPEGVGIDIALGALPFEEDAIARATPYEFAPGLPLLIVSAEDLIVMKAFADRPRDWEDIRGILVRQKGLLDFQHIYAHLTPLSELKSRPEIVEKLREAASS